MATMIVADLTGEVVGNYGRTISLQVTDTNGIAISLAGYVSTTNVIAVRSPDQLKVVTHLLSFDTSSGASGIASFIFASGDIDRPGEWECQLSFSDTTPAIIKTQKFIMDVEGALT
jgi:hypothetical protein